MCSRDFCGGGAARGRTLSSLRESVISRSLRSQGTEKKRPVEKQPILSGSGAVPHPIEFEIRVETRERKLYVLNANILMHGLSDECVACHVE